jgi:hypothetical protein
LGPKPRRMCFGMEKGPLHVCSLRLTGRFADDPERIPHEVIVHLVSQIGIHPPPRLVGLPRQSTDSAIRNRVRQYLGFARGSFNSADMLASDGSLGVMAKCGTPRSLASSERRDTSLAIPWWQSKPRAAS